LIHELVEEYDVILDAKFAHARHQAAARGFTLVAYPASGPIGSLLHRLSGQSTRPVQPVAADLAKLTALAEVLT
jgi:phage tail tape-measure protein